MIGNEHIDALIARYLSGEASGVEELELQQWRDESQEHEAYFRDLEFVFHATASITEHRQYDTDKAWREIAPAHRARSFRIGNWQSWAAAASLVLVAVSMFYFLGRPEKNGPYMAETRKEAATFYLPDSSRAELEAGSKLTALRKDPHSREYSFEGKGTFEVEHDESRPFILHHRMVQVEDLGTEFRFDAPPEGDTIKVKVYSGEVRFSTDTDSGLVLKPGEEAMYLCSESRFLYVTRVYPQQATFDFRATRLEDAVSQLGERFGKKIVLENPALRNCQISVSFENESLPAILDILSLTLHVDIHREGETIIIKGNACN